jgi:hypothetical protein
MDLSTRVERAIKGIEDDTLVAGDVVGLLRELSEERLFLYRWVERGMFDDATRPKNALDVMAHYPNAPWKNGRWDVSHKPYAAALYKLFPKAAAAKGDRS